MPHRILAAAAAVVLLCAIALLEHAPAATLVMMARPGGAAVVGDDVHGMTIPEGHPRLWYDASSLAAARTWADANPFNASGAAFHDQYRERATECLLEEDSTVCNTAVDWALAVELPESGVSCDECRWWGEAAILTFDWAYDYFTPEERATFISNWNGWLSHWHDQAWGGNHFNGFNGVPKYGNNYYWGYLRNDILWCIATAGENPGFEDYCEEALEVRWEGEFLPATQSLDPEYGISHVGGALPEGDQYGIYLATYANIPFYTAGVLGRDLYGESNFFIEALFGIIYGRTPAATTRSGATTGHDMFPYNDSQEWRFGGRARADSYVDFLDTMLTRYPATNMGRWIRQWLDDVASEVHSPHLSSTLPSVTALSFSSLPLDYFQPGIGNFYGRSDWATDATSFLWMLGQHGVDPGTEAATVGHRHDEIGSFQIWRNGRWLTRLDSSYTENIAGFAGSGSVDAGGLLGANTLVIGGTNIRYNEGDWAVLRTDSDPDFAYAATEFTDVYAGAASSVIREYVFVRSIETTVILDRVLTAGSTVKTWLAHFDNNPTLEDANNVSHVAGTQELRLTTLVPSSPTRRVVTEGGDIGQYRLEIDSPSGTQTYFLVVLQAKASADADLAPSVNDTGSAYEVTLNGSISVTFQKGSTSSGGSITISGDTTNFRSDVEAITVTTAGPVWED
jgi:hypothetical protein